jgi:putative PIN family toxin of toxin-antitoxin system
VNHRVVLDTSVLIAALRSSVGASYVLFQLIEQRRFVPVASVAILLEYEQVLKRDDQRQIHQLTLDEVDFFLLELTKYIERASIYYKWRPQLLDQGDEMILEAALNGRADAIVTHNIRDFREVQERFGLRILRPAQFLQEVRL